MAYKSRHNKQLELTGEAYNHALWLLVITKDLFLRTHCEERQSSVMSYNLFYFQMSQEFAYYSHFLLLKIRFEIIGHK